MQEESVELKKGIKEINSLSKKSFNPPNALFADFTGKIRKDKIKKLPSIKYLKDSITRLRNAKSFSLAQNFV